MKSELEVIELESAQAKAELTLPDPTFELGQLLIEQFSIQKAPSGERSEP